MSIPSAELLGPFFASAKMRALLSGESMLQRMLDVEAALAAAEASARVIPRTAVAPIAAACNAKRYDVAAIGAAAATAGNAAIPLVKALTAEVAKRNKEAARFVHWGATSQDIIDTATVLALREAAALLDRDLIRAIKAFVSLAKKHRKTVMPGRTWLQQALPTTFGLKAAEYAASLSRARTRIGESVFEASVLQFGGATGTLAALGDKGGAVARALGKELALTVPPAPWHAHNDRIVSAASAIAIAIGECGKIARDVSLLMQTEIGEVFEPAAAGRGGSSTMPQKRNPVLSAQILTAANIAPGIVSSLLSGLVQEQERGLGGWQASWLTLPQLLLIASGAFERTAEIATGLEIDKARMRANLELSNGAVMAEAVQFALAQKLGRMQAHELLAKASKQSASENKHMKEVLREMPEVSRKLTPKKLDEIFDPARYLGETDTFIDATLAAIEHDLKN
ncbi:MAG TPA: 3-carboxy-cis,cis-muconate cycloisomerase [Xanthobacteraceae bacterium]|nr:3-carboxy-cis,cis-muconate cycloisomerase [Xanthobacteraceae bacterium]